MKPENFEQIIRSKFPYEPTEGQKSLINWLSRFVLTDVPNPAFILKGYAGTGKTTIVSALINALQDIRMRSKLLAPTGRAAKVLSGYSGKPAFTIHKHIYKLKTTSTGNVAFGLQNNLSKNTVFIVDEASMIQDDTATGSDSLFTANNLLDDLVEYVYQGENCRLLLIGDAAQLPPVGLDISPSLDLDYMKKRYDLRIASFELKDVVRQSLDSGILANATELRQQLETGSPLPPFFSTGGFTDFKKINGTELEEALNDSYSAFRHEGTIIITRSNKRANTFNKEIRNRILFRDEEISAGDILMVVKNNYFWLPSGSRTTFIANGDMIEVLRIKHKEEMYGFRFADAVVRMVDYPDQPDLEVKLMLDTLTLDGPSLAYKEQSQLFDAIMMDYANLPSKRQRVKKVKESPYFNALQVKFAYALTCHKTQGGQWDSVFIDQGFVTEDMIDESYVRWLYTAVTRATRNLYLVNFHSRFFVENENGFIEYD
ncbi:MAG: AAA family ATPase [Bacteroidales bacterium]|nr:AAA family ATPase [Bacteroidales bacterium]